MGTGRASGLGPRPGLCPAIRRRSAGYSGTEHGAVSWAVLRLAPVGLVDCRARRNGFSLGPRNRSKNPGSTRCHRRCRLQCCYIFSAGVLSLRQPEPQCGFALRVNRGKLTSLLFEPLLALLMAAICWRASPTSNSPPPSNSSPSAPRPGSPVRISSILVF